MLEQRLSGENLGHLALRLTRDGLYVLMTSLTFCVVGAVVPSAATAIALEVAISGQLYSGVYRISLAILSLIPTLTLCRSSFRIQYINVDIRMLYLYGRSSKVAGLKVAPHWPHIQGLLCTRHVGILKPWSPIHYHRGMEGIEWMYVDLR